MYSVTRRIDFCYGHRLMGHPGKCRHPHGHNGRAEVTISAPDLDHQGMVVDFSAIEAAVATWIDDHLDHRMLLRADDPLVPVLRGLDEPVFTLDANPTAENIARAIYEEARRSGLAVTAVRLWETPGSCAEFRSG